MREMVLSGGDDSSTGGEADVLTLVGEEPNLQRRTKALKNSLNVW